MSKARLSNKKYYHFVDFIKAAAIFFVIFYHSFSADIDPQFSSVLDYAQYFIYSLLGTGVPFFFITNGFLLFQKESDLKKHIFKIVRIVGITAIWAVFTLALLMLLKGDSFSVNGFIKDLILLKPGYINHLWFMQALVFLYVLFPFLKRLYDNKFTAFKALFLFSVFYTAVIPTYCRINELNGRMPLAEELGSLPNVYFFFSLSYFMSGGIIYRIFKNRRIEKKYLLPASAVILLMFFIHTCVGVMMSKQLRYLFDNAWECYHSVFVFAAVFLIFVILYKHFNRKIPDIVRKIGSDSLGIYFIHQILICAARLLPNVKILCRDFIVNLIFAVCILFISFFIVELLKKCPFIKNAVKL